MKKQNLIWIIPILGVGILIYASIEVATYNREINNSNDKQIIKNQTSLKKPQILQQKPLPRKHKSIARPITTKPLQYSSGQISNLQFLDIRNNMKVMTEAQWKAYVRILEGKIIDWKGWIEEVNEKFFGGYELWIDMDSPHITMSVQDVTFDIPASLALKFNKDQIVYFRGRIKSIYNILGSCSINLENAAVYRTLQTKNLQSSLIQNNKTIVKDFQIIEKKMLNDALILSVITKTNQEKEIAEFLIKQNPGYYMIRVFFYVPEDKSFTDLPKYRYEWTAIDGLTKITYY